MDIQGILSLVSKSPGIQPRQRQVVSEFFTEKCGEARVGEALSAWKTAQSLSERIAAFKEAQRIITFAKIAIHIAQSTTGSAPQLEMVGTMSRAVPKLVPVHNNQDDFI